MADEKEIKAAEAQRLLEQLDPYLTKMEQTALDIAVDSRWETPEGAAEVHRALERVNVIRSLRADMKSIGRKSGTEGNDRSVA